MSEQNNLSEEQIAELKHQIREEIETEMLQKLESRQKFFLTKKNLDILFILGGFLGFVAFLVMTNFAGDFFRVFVTSIKNPPLFLANIPLITVLTTSHNYIADFYSMSAGIVFIAISPTLMFLKNPKLPIVFSSTALLYGINHILLSTEPYSHSTEFYTLILSYFFVSIGYFLRYTKNRGIVWLG